MGLIKDLYSHFMNDSIYRNSIYLMLNTLVMSSFGFIFWVINTRLFSVEQIGLATVLISSLALITGLSLFGFNTGIIRYLPKSENKVDIINTVITIILISTIAISIIYISGLNYFSSKLIFLKQNNAYIFIYIIFAVFGSLDALYSNVFIAYRHTKYILFKTIIGSIFKIFLPFLLISFGAFAIFFSTSFGSIITFFISLYILYKFFGYKFKLTIKKDIFYKIFNLSFINFIASFTASLPLNLLPLMIASSLGPKQAAYYYIDMSIITLLNAIQSSINQSLFAEGSNNDKELKKYIIKSVKFTIMILIPSIIFIILFGKYILLFFGKEYSSQGIFLLQLLALSVIFTSINGTLSTILNIKGRLNLLLMMCILGPLILLSILHFVIPKGLVTLGYGWFLGEGIIAILYSIIVWIKVL